MQRLRVTLSWKYEKVTSARNDRQWTGDSFYYTKVKLYCDTHTPLPSIVYYWIASILLLKARNTISRDRVIYRVNDRFHEAYRLPTDCLAKWIKRYDLCKKKFTTLYFYRLSYVFYFSILKFRSLKCSRYIKKTVIPDNLGGKSWKKRF